MKISLTTPLEAIVQKKVASGFYNNACEVVREALRLMHERDQREAAKLRSLRHEATLGFEGLDQGEVSLKNIGQIADEALVRHKTK